MPPAPPSSDESRSPPVSSRRDLLRLRCDLELVDDSGAGYRLRNYGAEGIRYTGPPFAGDTHVLYVKLAHREPPLQLTARPVWVQAAGEDRWEIGARLICSDDARRRLNFLVYSLGENQRLDDVRWIPFRLLEDRAALEKLPRSIAEHAIEGIAARAIDLCADISPRPRYLWQWAYEAICRTTLSCVAPELFDAAVLLKLCCAIFFTAIDDVVDEARDHEFFRQIQDSVLDRKPFHGSGGPERERQLNNLRCIHRFIRLSGTRLPRYAELSPWLSFDHGTVLQGMRYALLANSQPRGICADEQEAWNANSFFMLVFGDIDLMCSPHFDVRELGVIREVVHDAQAMCAISNWLGTWEREFRSGDYSSGVVGAAIKRRVITPQGLTRDDASELLSDKIRHSDVESYLLARWERHWRSIDASRTLVTSFDVALYLRGLEQVYRMQMASRGMI
jgi:hypothetical protein